MSDQTIIAQIREDVLVRSWTDPEFRDLVQRDPRAALASMGVELPEGVEVVTVTHRPDVLHLEVADGEAHPGGETLSARADAGEVRAAKESGGYICTFTRECNDTCWPGCTFYCSRAIQAC